MRGRPQLPQYAWSCRSVLLVCLLMIFAGSAPAPILAQTTSSDFPALIGRVIDQADMLSASQEAVLAGELAVYEERSSDQVVVATIPSLNGENLESYANRLFRHWRLGQEGTNNGILFLIAKRDRKIRVEVGYGLEGALTDAMAKTIIETVVVPRFKTGEFGNGIIDGARMITRVLEGDAQELEDRRRQYEENRSGNPHWFSYVFFAVWGLLFFGPILFAIGAPVFGKKIGRNRYRWLGIETSYGGASTHHGRSSMGGWSSGGRSGGGFSGGGGSSGGGGASGGW